MAASNSQWLRCTPSRPGRPGLNGPRERLHPHRGPARRRDPPSGALPLRETSDSTHMEKQNGSARYLQVPPEKGEQGRPSWHHERPRSAPSRTPGTVSRHEDRTDWSPHDPRRSAQVGARRRKAPTPIATLCVATAGLGGGLRWVKTSKEYGFPAKKGASCGPCLVFRRSTLGLGFDSSGSVSRSSRINGGDNLRRPRRIPKDWGDGITVVQVNPSAFGACCAASCSSSPAAGRRGSPLAPEPSRPRRRVRRSSAGARPAARRYPRPRSDTPPLPV